MAASPDYPSPRCSGLRADGQPCHAPAVKGTDKCRLHRDAQLPEPVRNALYSSRHAKYLPQHLLNKYEDAWHDPNIWYLRSDVAIVEMRIDQLLERMEEAGNASTLWIRLKEAWTLFQRTKNNPDSPLYSTALYSISTLIDEGVSEAEAWGELMNWIDAKRKLVESERKRLQAAGQMITAERALNIVDRLVKVVLENVTDPIALDRIKGEFGRLVTTESVEATFRK